MDKNRKIFRLGNNEPVETPPQLRMKSYDYKDLIKEAYEISTKNSNDFVINCNLAILSPEICPTHKINAYLLMSLAGYRCNDIEKLKILFEKVEKLRKKNKIDVNKLLVSILKIYYRYGVTLVNKKNKLQEAYEVSQRVNELLQTPSNNLFLSEKNKKALNDFIEECKQYKDSVITSKSSEKTDNQKRVFIIRNKEQLINYNFGFPIETKSLFENKEKGTIYKIELKSKTQRKELLYNIFLNFCSGVKKYYIPYNKLHEMVVKTDPQDKNNKLHEIVYKTDPQDKNQLHEIVDKTDLQEENAPFYILDCSKFIQIIDKEPFFQNISSDNEITQKHCGLNNLGNTCYFNSCLHCIYNCKLLSDMFLQPGVREGRLVKEYIAFINKNKEHLTNPISPTDVRNAFVIQNQKFNNYSQHDSMECMIDFLNTMNNELKDPYCRYFYSKYDHPLTQVWAKQLNLSDSLITKLCYGVIKYKIYDNTTVTIKYEPTLCLLLPIKEPKNTKCVNIDDCLKTFKTSNILLTNGITVPCQSSIVKLPYYLIIYLKRFYIERFKFLKNNVSVKYPKDLDITEYVDKSVKEELKRNEIKYKLLAVNEHNGGLFGGHYTAICRCGQEWIKYNDSSVSTVDYKSQKAFGLVYYLCNK